jgi:hypothetical protein
VFEHCSNGEDDDNDGLVDCEDPDCAGHLACGPNFTELLCDNGMDDDSDGKVDCDDPDCSMRQACNPDLELICNDELDNDGDGLTDCMDPDCWDAGNCQEHCSDGLDNDGDGLIDCLDPDCAEATSCKSEICDNGIDDDGDEKVDCLDPDCVDALHCIITPTLEICDNGIDDDGDGKVDCQDTDCAGGPHCIEGNCADGLDNDRDGHVDCLDPDCLSSPACQVSTSCSGAEIIGCGGHLGSTIGRVSSFGVSNCSTDQLAPGGERVYRFHSTVTQNVYLTLQSFTNNVTFSLTVLGGTSNSCYSDYCLQPNQATGEYTSYNVGSGMDIYLVVDSVEPEGGIFRLTVGCGYFTPVEFCGDGADNDDDGLIDCEDPDCQGSFTCNYWMSGGILCEVNSPNAGCALGEVCLTPQVPGSSNTLGICTRPCGHPNTLDPVCRNEVLGIQGYCDPSLWMTPASHCILQCGAAHPLEPLCPPQTRCVDRFNGTDQNVYDGICVP